MDALETPRLVLRRPVVEDAVVWRQLWTERDPRVPAHRQIDAEGRPTENDIARRIRDDRDAGLLSVVRRLEGDVIGYCGLVWRQDEFDGEPELAFELLRSVHGEGYATEAARAVIVWAGDAGHPRLWATVWDWNAPSLRVVEKLGFRNTGRSDRESEHGRVLLTVREG
jgi:RimJ/RimL family protein N-acetyltransferase